MADEKKLDPQYLIVTTRTDLDWLQTLVNSWIKKGYVPFWEPRILQDTYIQTMIDPQLLEVTVKEVKEVKKVTSSIVTIPGTVNVEWCECNCW